MGNAHQIPASQQDVITNKKRGIIMPVCSSPRIVWGNYDADKQTKKADAEAIVRHAPILHAQQGE